MITLGKQIKLSGIDVVKKEYANIDKDEMNILIYNIRKYMYSLVFLCCSFAFICVSSENVSNLFIYWFLLGINFVSFIIVLKKLIKKNSILDFYNYKIKTSKQLINTYKCLLNATFLYFEKKEDEFKDSFLYLNYIDINGVKQQIDISDFIIYNINNDSDTIEINLETKSISGSVYNEMDKKTERKNDTR